MRLKLLITTVILLGFMGLAFIDMQATPDAYTENKTVEKQLIAPSISLKTTDNKTITLQDFKGKIVMLNFWASWCMPCLSEFPDMMKLVENFKGDVVLIAISKDKNRQDIDKFLNRFPEYKNNPNLYIAQDSDKVISEITFNTFKIPETIIINKKGFMTRKIIGASPLWKKTDIKEYLEHLINGE